jgi:SAM-dependent methyltransferase
MSGKGLESTAKRILRNTWLFPRHVGHLYMRRAVKRAAAYAHGILIDIGCGHRPYESIFKDHVNNYFGTDWPVSNDKARQDISCDAGALPFKNVVADTVLSTELMEHLKDPNKFIEEIARIIRLGGHLLLSVPFLEPLHEEPRDFYRFTEYGLRNLLYKHGFEVIEVWERGHWWAVVAGSFIPQALFSYASGSNRIIKPVMLLLVLPFCAISQLLGYFLDHVMKPNSKYTLGFFIVAVRNH